jgi:hypothetical protein
MRPLVWILAAFGLVLLATAEAARPQLPRAGNMRYRPLPRVVRDFGNEGPPVDRRSHFLSARQFPGYATDNATMVLLEEVTGEDSGYDACGFCPLGRETFALVSRRLRSVLILPTSSFRHSTVLRHRSRQRHDPVPDQQPL